MRILVFAIILFFPAYSLQAANSTLISNFPAPSASYKTITIETQASNNTTCNNANPGNLGLLYYNTGTNTVQLCAKINGNLTTVPANQSCFNRYWNSGGTTPPNGCPAGYTQGAFSGVPTDSFTNGAYTVYSTVCCTTGSPIMPS